MGIRTGLFRFQVALKIRCTYCVHHVFSCACPSETETLAQMVVVFFRISCSNEKEPARVVTVSRKSLVTDNLDQIVLWIIVIVLQYVQIKSSKCVYVMIIRNSVPRV